MLKNEVKLSCNELKVTKTSHTHIHTHKCTCHIVKTNCALSLEKLTPVLFNMSLLLRQIPFCQILANHQTLLHTFLPKIPFCLEISEKSCSDIHLCGVVLFTQSTNHWIWPATVHRGRIMTYYIWVNTYKTTWITHQLINSALRLYEQLPCFVAETAFL